MKKYLKKWGVIQLAALSFIFIFEACCRDQSLLFGDAMVEVFDASGDASYMPTDTVSGAFRIEVAYSAYRVNALIPSPVTTAMATTCDFTPNNPIIPESFTITTDQELYGINDTLPAGYNLSQLDSLETEAWIEPSVMLFHFRQGLLDEYAFANGEHTFIVKGQTTNDVQLLDSVSVYFDL